MTMADKIVVMHDGKVEQIGAPLELYDHPANLFVAGFIGSPAMNFIEGRISLNGRARFISEAGVELPLNGAPGRRTGQTRPEWRTVGDGRGRSGRLRLCGAHQHNNMVARKMNE